MSGPVCRQKSVSIRLHFCVFLMYLLFGPFGMQIHVFGGVVERIYHLGVIRSGVGEVRSCGFPCSKYKVKVYSSVRVE